MRTVAVSDTVAPDEVEVIVIDDHLGMRKGLELLLRQEGLRVAGVAGALEEARALLARRRHDVALIDIHLGADNALGLVEERLRSDPKAAIVLYTRLRRGPRRRGPNRGARLRAEVLAGGAPDRRAEDRRPRRPLRRPESRRRAGRECEHRAASVLSPREMQILDLLADGLNGQAIAKHLFLSPETVRTHVRNATTKLGAHTRVQAVALVVGGRAGR